jgi:hypothetical protein
MTDNIIDTKKYTAEREYIKEGDVTIANVFLTKRAKELINDEGREKGESWIDYRERTKAEREGEVIKQHNIAKLFAASQELLIACQDAAMIICNHADGDKPEYQETHKLLMAAIHKATE